MWNACVERILHDDWSIRLGENRSEQTLKHMAAMLKDTGIAQMMHDSEKRHSVIIIQTHEISYHENHTVECVYWNKSSL